MSKAPIANFEFGNGAILKKFLRRTLVLPVFFAFKRNEAFLYSTEPEKYFKFRIKFGELFESRVHPIDKMGGTCQITSFMCDFKVQKNWYYFKFAWRPDVTRQYWNEQAYRKWNAKRHAKKYGVKK